MMRHLNKTYVRVPGGEIQYGHLSRSITLWWRGKRRFTLSLSGSSDGEADRG